MTKFSAFGTTLLCNGSPIAQISSISGPSLSADTVDVTTHDSIDAWEEVAITILRTGELTLELVYDPAVHSALLDLYENKTLEDYELQFPDDAFTAFQFDAYITAFEPSAPVDGALTASMTVKITGVPTLNATYTP